MEEPCCVLLFACFMSFTNRFVVFRRYSRCFWGSLVRCIDCWYSSYYCIGVLVYVALLRWNGMLWDGMGWYLWPCGMWYLVWDYRKWAELGLFAGLVFCSFAGWILCGVVGGHVQLIHILFTFFCLSLFSLSSSLGVRLWALWNYDFCIALLTFLATLCLMFLLLLWCFVAVEARFMFLLAFND